MSPPINALEAVFQAIADKAGFPIDQVRYIILLVLTYPVAFIFYRLLSPQHTSVTTRHVFSTAVGLAMGFICFGWQMLLLFAFIGLSYLLLLKLPPATVHHYSFAWVMGCISAAHLYRLLTDFGGYTLDFTGPLMVHVQKITLVACALHDGVARKESDLNDDQKANLIHEHPSILEYMSYMFNFHSFLAGPSCTMQEYLSFMDGSNLQPPVNPNQFANAKEHSKAPSPLYPAVTKLLCALLCLTIMILFSQYYTFDSVIDPTLMTTIPRKLLTLYLVCILIRTRYYFIWQLTDSINNAAGLGFSGYDKFGNAQWDIVSNSRILDIELGLNVRSYVGGWNCTTSKWIRRVIYERVKFFDPNMASFVVSAWWHGFYPNYYMMFIYMGIANEAGRKMRRLVRHHFQANLVLKWSYDVITHLLSEFFVDYGCTPFVLLWLHKGLALWGAFYYIPLIIICVIAFGFPSGKKGKKERATGSHTNNLVTNNLGTDNVGTDTQQSTQPKTEKVD